MICSDTFEKPANHFVLMLILNVIVSETTIDVNLPELQYLADHLEPQECRRLVAALHFHGYELPMALDEAERRVSKEVSCIRLLLHWNSEPGEGKGESHEPLRHRLRQLGHTKLAEWLGKTVFHQLGKDLERSMDNPFADLMTEQPRKQRYGFRPTEEKEKLDPTEWLAFDTICYAAAAILAVLILILSVKVVLLWVCARRKTEKSRKKKYEKLEEFDDSSSESEDMFDIRKHKRASI